MKETEAAWLAGAIDADGSIGYHDYGKEGRRISIRLYSTTPAFVERAIEVIGFGTMHVRKHKDGHLGTKDMYFLETKGSIRCYPILKEMLPWLIVKRERAESILQEVEQRPFGRWLSGDLSRHEAASEQQRQIWKNDEYRQRRLDGMRRFWTPEAKAAHSERMKAWAARRK